MGFAKYIANLIFKICIANFKVNFIQTMRIKETSVRQPLQQDAKPLQPLFCIITVHCKYFF